MGKPAGNTLWWSQVEHKHSTMPRQTSWKEAELELFTQIVRTMIKDGEPMMMIVKHFKDAFEIGTTAFYSRMKKMGVRWVLPLTMRGDT